MLRRRSKPPPRGNNSRSEKFINGGNWKKPWTENGRLRE